MKNFIYLLIVLTFVAACDKKPEIDVQAHRGGAGLYPENTKSAMKMRWIWM